MTWGFYGRTEELASLRAILARERWFFTQITGRRRIGKTAGSARALGIGGTAGAVRSDPGLGPAGVLSSVADAMDTFDVDAAVHSRPKTLQALTQTVGKLAEAGYFITLDEFQYFSRKPLYEFTSHLQAVVDDLSRRASNVPGGLLVLGSLHMELVALLEDRNAPPTTKPPIISNSTTSTSRRFLE